MQDSYYTYNLIHPRSQAYANGKGIKIIGDMPIYVGGHSADVWANRGLFELNEQGLPEQVSGVPPDAFSETGRCAGATRRGVHGQPLDSVGLAVREWAGMLGARLRRVQDVSGLMSCLVAGRASFAARACREAVPPCLRALYARQSQAHQPPAPCTPATRAPSCAGNLLSLPAMPCNAAAPPLLHRALHIHYVLRPPTILLPSLTAFPPPPFSLPPAGQLWGSPLYRWPAHKAEGYRWWCARMCRALELYDETRIDHFRGFAGGLGGGAGGAAGPAEVR